MSSLIKWLCSSVDKEQQAWLDSQPNGRLESLMGLKMADLAEIGPSYRFVRLSVVDRRSSNKAKDEEST